MPTCPPRHRELTPPGSPGVAAMSVLPLPSRRDFVRATAATALAGISRSLTMAAESPRLRIIDPHVHVWKNDPRYPWPAELKTPPKEDALPETLLELMRAHGVENTVIVHVIHYRWDCRYSADVVRAHRDKFAGVCRIDPRSATAVADLDHWANE